MRKILHIALLFCIFITAKISTAQSVTGIKDAYGRTVVLHGLNTSSSAKGEGGGHSDHQPWIKESDVEREFHSFGFNAVRYLIFWGAIEPEMDKYDDAYLAKVKERVEWYTSRKMYVIFDMHQDVYGYGVGGNGAPVWASSYSKTKNLVPDKWPWWMQNMEPTVVKSYVQFFKYKKKKELQDHYIKAWLKVVDMFKDNPYVIGYDLMNEPHGGKLGKTLAGGFERQWLSAMYKRLIPAIRKEDTSRYIFFEPRSFGVNFGMKSHLPAVKDTIVNKLVYAPHCYLTFVDVGGDYKKKHKNSLKKWFKYRQKETAKHQSGLLLGEFGLSPGKKDFDKYLNDIFYRLDAAQGSWTYWSSDLGGWGPLNGDRSPSPILNELLRIYPQAVAGELLSYSYKPAEHKFTMHMMSDTSIHAPTIISIPLQKYPSLPIVNITSDSPFEMDRDSKNNTIILTVKAHRKLVDIEIAIP